MSLALIIERFVQIYIALIFIRFLLTWFQTASWANQVIAFLSPFTDPYVNLFRSIIPPLGGMDFSPIFAVIVLQLVSGFLIQALSSTSFG